MKPTWKIPDEMLANEDEFLNDFFSRFRLRHAPSPIELEEGKIKNYRFPSFYGDVTQAVAIFLCDYQKTAVLIADKLHPKVKPVKISKGRSLIAFSCYEYKKVMNIRPYNEIAMAIPVMVNARFNPPLLPMITSLPRFGYYIAGMPVTSYENMLRGHNIWGLPKVTHQIDVIRQGDDCTTIAYEEAGEPYLTITVPMSGARAEFDEKSNLYTRHNGRICQCETNFKGAFNITKHSELLFKKGIKPEKTYLTIGDSPSAAFLRQLDIEEHPFQLRYAEHVSSCFDLPKEDPPAWVKQLY